MVVKKVAVARGAPAKSKTVHIRHLCDYIAGGGAREGEKVERRGSVNLLNGTHDEQVQEIADLAEVARRSPQPVQHWILSWRDGEQPTAAQADEAFEIFLAEMSLGLHQVLYALHRDTDNWHLHLAVNRVHPGTERLVTVNGGFDLEVAHRALARIEHAQGWARERLGRYRVNAGGAVERATSRRVMTAQPRGRVRDGETRSGQKSAQRVAIEEAGPMLRKARAWQELHDGLAKRGMRVEAKGSGALVWVGLIPVKASVLGRDCSMAALERRLGKYQRSAGSPSLEERKPQVLCEVVPGWATYNQDRQRYRADKTAARAQLRAKHAAEVMGMRQQQRVERLRVFDRDWVGKGQLLNAIRSLVAAEHSKRRASTQQRQRRERGELRQRLGRFPDFEQWLRRRDGHQLAQRWRHREGLRSDSIQSATAQSAAPPSGAEGQARASYERHLAELLREPGVVRRDASRIDLEIAIRMRVTGHDSNDVQRAIEERAPQMRPGERRDWKEYARRTAVTAFGVPGDRQVQRLARLRTRWLRVEGRHTDELRPYQTRAERERDR